MFTLPTVHATDVIQSKPSARHKKLYIFDYDCTLTKVHTHKDGYGIGNDDPCTEAEIEENRKKNIKHPQLLRAIFTKIHSNQDDFAIASHHFGREKDIPPGGITLDTVYVLGPKYIRENLTLGIPGFDFSQVSIRAYATYLAAQLEEEKLEKEGKKQDVVIEEEYTGKNPFILYLVGEFNKKYPEDSIDLTSLESRKRIIFFEDDKQALEHAGKSGYTTAPLVSHHNVFDKGYIEFLIQDVGLNVQELQAAKKDIVDNFYGSESDKKLELEYVDAMIQFVIASSKSAAEKSTVVETKSVSESLAMAAPAPASAITPAFALRVSSVSASATDLSMPASDANKQDKGSKAVSAQIV